MNVENESQKFIERQLAILSQILKNPIRRIQQAIAGIINRTDLSQSEISARLGIIDKAFLDMASYYGIFSTTALPAAYQDGANILVQYLKEKILKPLPIDSKAVNILIKDASHDFTIAAGKGQQAITTFFKFSKQGNITETQISEAVANGLIDKQTAKAAKEVLRETIRKGGQSIFDLDSFEKYRQRIGVKVPDGMTDPMEYLKTSIKTDYGYKLQNSQFMQLINKNGDVMNFQTDKYADLVARTRIGDAQTQGTLDAGAQYGITEYQVTDHNTETKKCREFEGQIYTTDPSNTKFLMLTKERTPTYHPNCKHRLRARKFTLAQLEKMPDVR